MGTDVQVAADDHPLARLRVEQRRQVGQHAIDRGRGVAGLDLGVPVVDQAVGADQHDVRPLGQLERDTGPRAGMADPQPPPVLLAGPPLSNTVSASTCQFDK